MPLLHVAWFRFEPGVDPKRIEEHLRSVRVLKDRVPAVMDVRCGPNVSDRAGGFTHGIVVTLADREALAAYLDHPAHVPVATALKADIAELKVMDISA